MVRPIKVLAFSVETGFSNATTTSSGPDAHAATGGSLNDIESAV
jgi:hypothetical protein